MTRFRWFGVLLGAMLVTAGCGGDSRAHHQQAPALRVALLLDSLKEERWHRDQDLFVERAKELGGEVSVKVANGDAALQEQQAKDGLAEGAKALVVVPVDTEKAGAIVALAAEKKVPVISYDRLIRNADIALYVSFDNVKVGRMQAEYLLNKRPEGELHPDRRFADRQQREAAASGADGNAEAGHRGGLDQGRGRPVGRGLGR